MASFPMNYFKWLKLDIVKRFKVVHVIFQYRHVPFLPDQLFNCSIGRG